MPSVSQAQLKASLINMAKGKRKKHRKRQFNLKSKISNFIYPYKQYCDGGSLTQAGMTTATTGSFYAWQFTLDMIPQVATFVALYDKYRIRQIEFTIRPRALTTSAINTGQGTVAQQYLTTLIVAVDNDDANVPASYNALREYGNAKEFAGHLVTKPIKIVFRPAVAMLSYNNGITFGSSERFSPWIDCANTAVPHYGLKAALGNTASNNLQTFDVSARYLVEFCNVR